ncbi:MAG: dephospho-CoA kinase [Bacteroidales bacterium]|nr:dephospho-CoA kinase [Candidatus Cacconaster equi]
MKRSKVILCTGGIGSGKSYVIRAFNAAGIPSYDTDAAAKRLYDTDRELLDAVSEIAGKDVSVDGHLDRGLLASRIFADSSLLGKIEDVVHPAVIRDFRRWEEEQSVEVVIIESAIMLEKPSLRGVADYVLVVSAPEELRIKRVMERDGISREAVLSRMARQWNDRQREEYADFIIVTDERHQIVPEIVKIIETVKNGKDRS